MFYFNTNKPQSFFFQNTSCIRKPQVISGGGGGKGCASPVPSPKIRPWVSNLVKVFERITIISVTIYDFIVWKPGFPPKPFELQGIIKRDEDSFNSFCCSQITARLLPIKEKHPQTKQRAKSKKHEAIGQRRAFNLATPKHRNAFP